MLEFKEVFPMGSRITSDDVSSVMQCKNIDYGHVGWDIGRNHHCGYYNLYNSKQLMLHLINNVIDVNVHDNNDEELYTLLSKVMVYCSEPKIIHYMLNNGGSNICSFDAFYVPLNFVNCKCCVGKYYKGLITCLSNGSLDKHLKFYNLQEYYYLIHTLLLVVKVQRVLPGVIVKHVIIPFVYQ